MRVLVVEDDVTLAAGLIEGLAREGFQVDHLDSAEPAEGALGLTAYDLSIVDIGLPGMDGLELIRRVRRRGLLTPILIHTARDGLDDRVQGSTSGRTTTCSSPSCCRSCWPACAPWCAAAAPPPA